MTSEKIIDRVINNPIIAAVSGKDAAQTAVESPCEVIFLLNASIRNAKEMVTLIHSAEKLVLIHVDSMKGLSADAEGLEHLREVIQPDGVITANAHVIKTAKVLGLITVQQLLILDSKSVDMGIKQLKEMHPDFVEIMPGAMVKVIERISARVETPVIAGGLVDKEQEVISLLKAGAVSVSTSDQALWLL